MKFGVMILIGFAFTLAMCFILQQVNVSAFKETKETNPDIPATWNLDWQGGPGFDRLKILNEKGPYNPDGVY